MIYEGLTVLTEDPNRRDQVSQSFTRSKVRVDSGTGPFTDVSKTTVGRQVRQFTWFMPNRAEIQAFRTFMSERAGRLVPFWIPTWHHDLQLDTDVLVPSATLTVINVGYSRYQFDAVNTWRRHLAFIKIGAGIQFIRRIDASTEATTTEQLSLASAPDSTMVKGQWMLSFLTMCRLESDQYTLDWYSKTVAEATFAIRELPQETTPVPV